MFDKRVHDHWDPPDTQGSRSLVEEMLTAGRAESQAAARRLKAPSHALADFVRARDLTCRAPGCDRPGHRLRP